MICEQQAKKAMLKSNSLDKKGLNHVGSIELGKMDAFRLVQGERGAHSKVTALKPVYAGNQAVRSPTKKQKEGKK